MDVPSPNEFPRCTPPKSAERIRAALESVHSNRGPSEPAGPMSKGLQADAPVVVASFHDPTVGRKFQERLIQAGLMSNARQERRRFQVLVDAVDRGPAAALLPEVLARFPDRFQNVRARILDYALLLGAIGATLSFVGVAGTSDGADDLFRVKNFLIVGGFAAYSAVMGGLLADLRFRLFRGGRWFQFGIRDLMLVVAMVALSLVVWHYARGLV